MFLGSILQLKRAQIIVLTMLVLGLSAPFALANTPAMTDLCARLLLGTDDAAATLSVAPRAYLLLVKMLTEEKGVLSAESLDKIVASENPVELLPFVEQSSLSAEEKHALGVTVRRLVPQLSKQWPDLARELSKIKEEQFQRERARGQSKTATMPLFVARKLKTIPKLGDAGHFLQQLYMLTTADGTVVLGEQRSQGALVLTNLSTEKSLKLDFKTSAFLKGFAKLGTQDIAIGVGKDEVKFCDALTGQPVWEYDFSKEKIFTGTKTYQKAWVDPDVLLYQKENGKPGVIMAFASVPVIENSFPFRDRFVEVDFETKKLKEIKIPQGHYRFYVSQDKMRPLSAALTEGKRGTVLQVTDLESREAQQFQVPTKLLKNAYSISVDIGEAKDKTSYVALQVDGTLRIYNLRSGLFRQYKTGSSFNEGLGFVQGPGDHFWYVPRPTTGWLTFIDVYLGKKRRIEAPFMQFSNQEVTLLRTKDERNYLVTNHFVWKDGRHIKHTYLVDLKDGSIKSIDTSNEDSFEGPRAAYETEEGWLNTIVTDNDDLVLMQVYGPTKP